MDVIHRVKREHHFLLNDNSLIVDCQKKYLNNDNDNNNDNDYEWLNDINKKYNETDLLKYLNNNDTRFKLNPLDDSKNNYGDSSDSDDSGYSSDNSSDNSSNSSDNSSDYYSDDTTDTQEPLNKKSKKENINEIQEEINDLKKDAINNSSSYDHIEIALDNLKQIRNEFSKDKVFEIIKKFKDDIEILKKLDKTSGVPLIDNLYNKYKNAYDEVYKMVTKEYSIKKEKLNINKWVSDKITERKKNAKEPNNNSMVFTILYPQSNVNNMNIMNWGGIPINKEETKLLEEFENLYKKDSSNKTGIEYFKMLTSEQKKDCISKLKDIKMNDGAIDNKPFMAKILDCDTTVNNKSIILSKINTFENLKGSSEFYKLKSWINKIMKVPFGKYVSAPVNKNDNSSTIKKYLQNMRTELNKEIYGHEITKQQLIKIMAHTIANPNEGGNIFALQGPPGVGKTALIQDGISKALSRPFSFISLGGATDACFLEGHDYTYEGSNHGRIVELLQQAKCMNPIIYFDELDKVSETPKGEEIINILMHITDATQNSHFNDKYFGGIDFDLSKAIIIFSFNDEQKISRILRDRMKIIRVKGYKLTDKIKIAKNHLLPKLMKSVGLNMNVKFSDDILEYIIDTYTNEGGVRKLKELLNDILLEINLRKMEDEKILGKKITNKIEITKDMLDNDFLRKKHKVEHIQINEKPFVGQVNGLWANEYGVGGLIPIECCWIPTKEKMDLELTGMQGKVMKESMSVARTVAWRILPDDIKEKLNKKWQNSFDFGVHIHCPDGSTPKDGPSAGGAITTCLISLLSDIPVNNKIAMTGEINLKGHITKIGGLEEKIFGAKKAGAELVLCPDENSKDLQEIKEKFPNLFNEKFAAKTIKNIWEILDLTLTKKILFNKF